MCWGISLGYANNIGSENKTLNFYFENENYNTELIKTIKEANPEYLLGDNYWDDYRNCPKCTKYINVGNGILSKLHLKNMARIKNMYEIFKVLK